MIINRRIVTSLATIGTAGALLVGATFAFFSSSATSEDNVFAAGSLTLNLDDGDESADDGTVTASIGDTGMAPGDSTTGFISLDNAGSIDIAEVEFGATLVSNDDGPGTDGTNLADVLDLTVETGNDSLCDTATVDQTAAINTALGGGPSLTLSDLIAADYDALPGVNSGDTKYVCITATMQSTAGNNYQGDSVTVDFNFTGNQDVSQ